MPLETHRYNLIRYCVRVAFETPISINVGCNNKSVDFSNIF